MMREKWFEIPGEIEKALKDNKPVVALESTLIAQGLPYPKNIEVALAMEEKVREAGAIPATIGVINGVLKVGLTRDDVEYLGNGKNEVIKVGEGELPFAIGSGKNASTTVSGTAWVADKFNIKVFATGGTGGVHKGVSETFDISQDLFTMSKTPIVIVSSGAKSILDLHKTAEQLESYGIMVLGYGTDTFPAFYSRNSDIKLNYRVDSAQEVAKVYDAKMTMKSNQTILVANPVPADEELPASEIDAIIEASTNEAAERGIGGKELTPFLLANIAERSEGRSMKANIALLLNNARTAGDIAVEIATEINSNCKGCIGFHEKG
jgi:pseudouridine-5'-phosphate glycosidase